MEVLLSGSSAPASALGLLALHKVIALRLGSPASISRTAPGDPCLTATCKLLRMLLAFTLAPKYLERRQVVSADGYSRRCLGLTAPVYPQLLGISHTGTL